ncbi:hypothetical protein ABFS82_04G111200 [Erythranthe guttata]|uniref:WRKY domain-containing protein n=1 Tax=Erythranthe guttata TaxID=4155 RepID=A0A022QDM6_ERYGU|nr:PREDICTED: probable WRKY transcription factor 40 [Erythranthe guttata]EYU24595.1 hypothetical protein MIMGU_mgv1a009879mg [Erythranthe guttata]|eukprot:XP_012852845.1 PREDICTED: probable WRKY transcription factor 40 [Erythranthe guttata]
MEFTSLLNTSLNLNTKPLRFLDESPAQKQEVVESSFTIGLERNSATLKEERGALVEEINRVNAENKKLTEILTVMCENYNELRNQLAEHQTSNNNNNNHGGVLLEDSNNNNITASKKRKADQTNIINSNNNNNNVGNSESSSSDEDSSKKLPREEIVKAKISRVFVRTESSSDSSLIVKDGYQWRKYGQKVTRDNPCPRAYFKCSFAPTCPVKKKVQRSIEDQSIVVATYEGEHNHSHQLSKNETNSTSLSSTAPSISVVDNLAKKTKQSKEDARSSNSKGKIDSSPQQQQQLQHYLVEQMASTLTKDPNFKAALAAAISGKFLSSAK